MYNTERGLKGGDNTPVYQREKQPSPPVCLPVFNACQLPQNLLWQLGIRKPNLDTWILPPLTFDPQPHPLSWSGCSHHCGHADL